MIEIDIEQMIRERVLAVGGTEKDFKDLVALAEELANKKRLNIDGLLMIVLDCVDGKFCRDNAIKQLKIACGEFDQLPGK